MPPPPPTGPQTTPHTTPPETPDHARVVLLAGPSGAGKSRLAERLRAAYGWPIVRLDDFYKDLDAPGLPKHPALDVADWDHPDSWDGAAACAALEALITTGCSAMPVYDISRSKRVGEGDITARPTDLVLAEGIFAAELIAPLRERGLLHSAWCVRNRPALTFIRRLARDLKERRKPPLILIKRGVALLRAEPDVVARASQKGAQPATAKDVEAALRA